MARNINQCGRSPRSAGLGPLGHEPRGMAPLLFHQLWVILARPCFIIGHFLQPDVLYSALYPALSDRYYKKSSSSQVPGQTNCINISRAGV